MCCSDNFDFIVQDEGADVVKPASTLNFEGAGVTVTDGGNGVAVITIPGGGGADTKQVFRYTADGSETATFTVTLPAARASADYNVQCTMGGPTANAFKDARPLVATFTTTEFDVECPVAPDNGDIFMFTVEDLT